MLSQLLQLTTHWLSSGSLAALALWTLHGSLWCRVNSLSGFSSCRIFLLILGSHTRTTGIIQAKAFAALVEASDAATSVCGGRGTPPTLLFWQTKSAVQPRSEVCDPKLSERLGRVITSRGRSPCNGIELDGCCLSRPMTSLRRFARCQQQF